MSAFSFLITVTSIICLFPLGLYLIGRLREPFHPLTFVGGLAFFVACFRPWGHLSPALHFVSEDAIDWYLAVTCVSVLGFYVGWYLHWRRQQRAPVIPIEEPPAYDANYLMVIGMVYIGLGVGAYLETRNDYSVTGYLRDWAALWVPGFILVFQSMLLEARKSLFSVILMGVALIPPVDRFIVYGQRGDSFRVVACCFIPYFLFFGRRPRRPLVIPAMLVVGLTLGVLDRTRALVGEGLASNRIEALLQVIPSFFKDDRTTVSGQEEFIYGAAMIDTVRATGTYNYGRCFADMAVRFLPKEFFNKEHFYSRWSRTNAGRTTGDHTGYLLLVGSMPTGFADAFVEFWWLSPVFWGLLGYWFRKHYMLASLHGRLDYQGYFTILFVVFLYLIAQDLYDALLNWMYCGWPLWAAYRMSRVRMAVTEPHPVSA